MDLFSPLSDAVSPDNLSTSMQLFLLMTAIALLPSLLMLFTCFIRLIVVLHLLRQAMGVQNVPPNHVLTGLALMITVSVMSPVAQQVYDLGIEPYQAGEIHGEAALQSGLQPVKSWMLNNTRQSDLELFLRMNGAPAPATRADTPMSSLVPAFLISELKTAFQIGFLLFLPFLVVDLVVSSVLLSMGMMMLPPVMISFPFKILLFVLVDGWSLLIASLVSSIN